MTLEAKVQIGNTNDFLEGTRVDTSAGVNLFREGVVISDPEFPEARCEVRQIGALLTEADYGLVTHSVIQGRSSQGGGTLIDVKVNPSGSLLTEVSTNGTPLSTVDSTDLEYLRVATSVNAVGDTTLVTPTAGKRIRLQWVYAINDPAATNSTKITIKLGSDVQYVAWAISKRQQLTGVVDAPLVINLSQTGDVAVTIFYQEVD